MIKNNSTVSRTEELITLGAIFTIEMILFMCWALSVDTSPAIVYHYLQVRNLII